MFNYRNFLRNCDSIVGSAVDKSQELSDLDRYSRIEKSLVLDVLKRDNSTNGTAYFCGSRSYGLATDSSDLDIYVDVVGAHGASNYHDNFYSEDEKANLLDDIYWSLEDRTVWAVVYLPKTKVPLIRAKYLPWDLKCDITVQNGLVVAVSDLIEHLFDIQPEAKWFFHFIRIWLENHNVKFKTYTLAMLVIFFFQNEKFMPLIEKVRRKVEMETINGIEIQFDQNRTICNYGTKKLRDYKTLLADFFEFYSDYDFQNNFISVADGKSYDWQFVSNIPEMNKPMCVSGIFQNDLNAGNLVSHKKLDKFQRVCGNAVDILNNNYF